MLPYINAPFAYAADRLGASADEIKLIFSFLLSYPLAGLLKRVPDTRPELKNLFIIGVSVFYLVGLFDLWIGLRTIAISSAVAYALANSPASGPTTRVTGAQMVLVIKLSAFCWNVADGCLPDDALTPFQRDRALRTLPGLLDYAGYVLFFPALLAGPACDFAEYRRWLDTSMFAVPASLDPAKRPPTRRRRRIPRSGTPAMRKMAAGLAWVAAYIVLIPRYAPSVLLADPVVPNASGGSSTLPTSFLFRVWLLYAVGLVARIKYYGVWSLTEGACILAGLGFNGVDPATGRIAWDRVANIDPWGVETAPNTRAYLENWNMKTNAWLRNYVYLRVTPRGRKPGFRASLATFCASAVWHGFYPGYYLSFVLASLPPRRYVRPWFFLDPATLQRPAPAKRWLYDPLSVLATQVTFAFVVAPFLLLTLPDSLHAWARVHFYGVVGVAAWLAVFASPAKPALKRALEARAARAAQATQPQQPHKPPVAVEQLQRRATASRVTQASKQAGQAAAAALKKQS
ncbi:mboat family protein [Niveomyces insectorum RCEF 264]|uniref:Mboat family protein n=1 Tax=Niveomyces insectorum RCEF 264 TaxID=1081102 RepID=A0A167QQW8_9HYPO|nr:mboat family protein [Niveomyces insectorum RCEF 264]